MKIREGRADGKGFSPDEPDYTLGELKEEAERMAGLYSDLKSFLKSTALAHNMAENIPDASSEAAPLDGKN